MTIEKFISNIDLLLNELQNEMPDIADKLSLNALAMIKNRIVDERAGINGKHYSTKLMLATKDNFIVKSAFKQTHIDPKTGESAKRKRTKGTSRTKPLWIKFPNAKKAVPVMILPNGYKQFREIQGRQADVVDGSYTGKMWQGTTIIERRYTGYNYVTLIGGSNTEAQNKLLWLTNRFGSFLTLLPDEIELTEKTYKNYIQNILNKYLHE